MKRKFYLIVVLAILLSGCVTPAIPTEPEATITVDISQLEGHVVVANDLGETTITQSMFSEDSHFYNMPVRLNGIIAAPTGDDGPYPLVIIFHGNHWGCPMTDDDMIDRWPCEPEVEQRNYGGFAYLVQHLADEGYVALSINVNAEYTFGFGEPIPFERLDQLLELHLEALTAANAGDSNDFGVDLMGRVDLSRLVFFGHSQGGEGAFFIIQRKGLDSPDAMMSLGYGPAYGLMMIAPSANFAGADGARLPLAVLIPACDGDVFNQDGQLYYEITRLTTQNTAWASSVWLEQANHNYFNEILSDEGGFRQGRIDCEPILDAEIQQAFLKDYAVAFLSEVFEGGPADQEQLGLGPELPAPDNLFGVPAIIAALTPGSDRLPLLVPLSEGELATSLVGGQVSTENVTTFYCEEGYYTPFMKPGSEPCKRVNLVIPGYPAMVVLTWEQKSGALRFTLPEGHDLSQYTAISLRAAVDPLSNLNETGVFQAFSIKLIDKQGNTATVRTRADEPALHFPEGYVEEDDVFDGGLFTGRIPLTTIRMPLGEFSGINLSEIVEIVLLFDQTTSGALFISDIELIR